MKTCFRFLWWRRTCCENGEYTGESIQCHSVSKGEFFYKYLRVTLTLHGCWIWGSQSTWLWRCYLLEVTPWSFFFFNLHSGGVESRSTRHCGLLCQPRVIMIMEKWVEWLAGETEVLGENLPQCRFVHHKPHMLPVRELGTPRWEARV
jgi:hypothetical protein